MHKKLTKTGLAFLIALAIPLYVQAASLQDAVNQTLADHPKILSTQLEQAATGQDVRKAKGGLYPSLSGEVGQGHEKTDNPATRAAGEGDAHFWRQESNFLIRQLLFDGGNVTNNIRQAKANYQTRTLEVNEAKELLGFNAAEAYLNVMKNRELVYISKLNVKAHTDLLTKIRRRYEAGAGSHAEVQLADSRLALAQANLAQQEGLLAQANDTYIQVVGRPPPEDLVLPIPPTSLPLSLSQAQKMAEAMNPTLLAAKAQIAAAQAAVGIAKSAFYPTVALEVSASYNNNLDGVEGYNNQSEEMLRVRYNLFNGGSDKAAVSAANYRVTAAQETVLNTQRDVNQNVALAWDDLQASFNRLPGLQVHSIQSFNVWQAYEKQFQLGQRTLFDLLNTQAEYYDARSALTNVEYDIRVGRYRLLASMGNFVATVQNSNRNFQAQASKSITNKVATQFTSSSIPKPKITKLAAKTEQQIPTVPNVPSTTYIPSPDAKGKPTKLDTKPAIAPAATPTTQPAVKPSLKELARHRKDPIADKATLALAERKLAKLDTKPATAPVSIPINQSAATPNMNELARHQKDPIADKVTLALAERKVAKLDAQPAASLQASTPVSQPLAKTTVDAQYLVDAGENLIQTFNKTLDTGFSLEKSNQQLAVVSAAEKNSVVAQPIVQPLRQQKDPIADKAALALAEISTAKTQSAEPDRLKIPRYTIQLLAAKNVHTVENLIAKNHLVQQVQVHTKTKDTEKLYILTYGQYSSKLEAEQAKQHLAANLQALKPNIVKLSPVV